MMKITNPCILKDIIEELLGVLVLHFVLLEYNVAASGPFVRFVASSCFYANM